MSKYRVMMNVEHDYPSPFNAPDYVGGLIKKLLEDNSQLTVTRVETVEIDHADKSKAGRHN